MSTQLALFKTNMEYGGAFSRGQAKTKRPLSIRKPLHITLRSSKAVGRLSLLRHKAAIEAVLLGQSMRWNIRIYEYSINSTHLHLNIRGQTRLGLQNFFRSLAGLVARLVTRAEKGKPFGKFWDETLWSRVANWGKAFHTLNKYIRRNILESAGIISYERKHRYPPTIRTG